MSRTKKPKRYLFEEVLDFLKHNDSKAFNYKQLGAAMEINLESQREELIHVLDSLKEQGFVLEKDKGRYQVKSSQKVLTGSIDFTSMGTAFVSVDPNQADVFIPAKKTRDALQGDLVKVVLQQRSGGRRQEGEVTEVIKRARTQFVGTIRINPKFAAAYYSRAYYLESTENYKIFEYRLRINNELIAKVLELLIVLSSTSVPCPSAPSHTGRR